MKRSISFKAFLVLCAPLVAWASDPVAHPLKNSDKLALFLKEVKNEAKTADKVRVKAALCIAPERCREIVVSPTIELKAGETIDFATKELKKRRSKIYTGEELNELLAKLIDDKKSQVKDPKPEISILLVKVDGQGKTLEKSKIAHSTFPEEEAEGPVIANEAELKLGSVTAKVRIGIERI